ncbi:hypothetical protein STEG23_003831 [Scotinomys teguina]
MMSGVLLGPLGPISFGYTWVLLVQWRPGAPGSQRVACVVKVSGCSWVLGGDWSSSQAEIDIRCGENIFMASYPASWSRAIQSWYDEAKDFKFGSGPNTTDAKVEHYTQFIFMVYYIDRVLYVEPSLHLWDKAYLIMGNNVFDVFLESVCQYFIEYFCINVHEGDCHYISIFISDFIDLDALSLSFALSLIISWCLFLLGDFASSCSRAFSFNLVDLSIGESGVLKSPTINVWDLMLESSF